MENDNPEQATGIEIKVYGKGIFVGLAAQLTSGRWEVHPEPVECGPWTYTNSAEEAVRLLNADEQQTD